MPGSSQHTLVRWSHLGRSTQWTTIDRHPQPNPPARRRRRLGRRPVAGLIALAVTAATVVVVALTTNTASAAVPFEIQSLDGSGNNVANPTWGAGRHQLLAAGSGPLRRRRRHADRRAQHAVHQQPDLQRRQPEPVLRARRHPVGLRRGASSWTTPSACGRRPASATRPTRVRPTSCSTRTTRWRRSPTHLGNIPFTRSSIAPGTGTNGVPREQVNTVSSYIDAFSVYGGTDDAAGVAARGFGGRQHGQQQRHAAADRTATCPAATRAATPPPRRPWTSTAAWPPRPNRGHGSPATCGPTRTSRLTAHAHAVRPRAQPDRERPARPLPEPVARRTSSRSPGGSSSPSSSTSPTRNGCRRWASTCPRTRGYRSNVNANLGNEFATAAYRAHSMIHGEFELEAELDRYSPATLDALGGPRRRDRSSRATRSRLAIPLNLAFFNPDLLEQVQLGPMLQGIGLEAAVQERRADRQPAAQRAVPDPGAGQPRVPGRAGAARVLQRCRRPRRHRHRARPRPRPAAATTSCARRSGCRRRRRSPQITGESTDQFPAGTGIDNPNSIDFLRLFAPRRQPDPARQRAGRGRADPGRAAHHSRRAAAGHLRQREQHRRLHRHARRGARDRRRLRRDHAGRLGEAVPGPARRRPVLLPEPAGGPGLRSAHRTGSTTGATSATSSR